MTTYHLKARYLDDEGVLQKAKYEDGSLALAFFTDEGRETISINLVDHGYVAPPGHFYVKNYSEHEGLADSLVEQGVAEKGGGVTFGPFGSVAYLMRLVADLEAMA